MWGKGNKKTERLGIKDRWRTRVYGIRGRNEKRCRVEKRKKEKVEFKKIEARKKYKKSR